jgi:GNAT superfamily N-acetyltransferase
MTVRTRIRNATVEDAEDIVRLVQALAIYEKMPVETVKLTAADVRRDAFPDDGGRPYFECLIAELDGEPVGLALVFHNYSTWEGRSGIYVEDLFVEERARGHGLGRDLMAAVAAMAQARGCVRIDLSVLDWNPTRDFYHRIEMRHMKEWLYYRMTEPAIGALVEAAGDDTAA